jgi:flagellar biogenesis protein FliO
MENVLKKASDPAARRRAAMLVLLAVCFTAYGAGEPGGGIGNFDIEKVRTATLHAGDTAAGPARTAPEPRENAPAIALRVTAYLGIVIVLILAVAWLVRKGGVRSMRPGGPGSMDIVETLQLGGGRMLIMVRVMDEIYCLAQTATAVTLLDKIGGQKALDIIASSRGGGTMLPFKDAFNSFMGKIRKPS